MSEDNNKENGKLKRPRRVVIWKIEETKKRNASGTVKRVTACRVTSHGKVVPIGSKEDTFVDDFQLLMDLLEEKKVLPVHAFIRDEQSGGRVYSNAWHLNEAGIANVVQL
jgi:hypothetical protein